MRRRKVCHRRSSSLMDKVSNDAKFLFESNDRDENNEETEDIYKSSDFQEKRRYLSGIDRRNQRNRIHREKINKKKIV